MCTKEEKHYFEVIISFLLITMNPHTLCTKYLSATWDFGKCLQTVAFLFVNMRTWTELIENTRKLQCKKKEEEHLQ